MRERLHKAAGLTEPPKPKFRLEDLQQSEWSTEFERLMRNRLVMGAFRYGLLADKRVKGKKWDLIEPIRAKVELYEQTGNTEYLVDAANYCLLAFECDNHPLKHFKALDDHHDHCKRRRNDRRKPGSLYDKLRAAVDAVAAEHLPNQNPQCKPTSDS